MSSVRDRVPYGLLSRYEWGFCAVLATLMIVGVALEISRMASKSRKAKLPEAALHEVGSIRTATESPVAENLSAR